MCSSGFPSEYEGSSRGWSVLLAASVLLGCPQVLSDQLLSFSQNMGEQIQEEKGEKLSFDCF